MTRGVRCIRGLVGRTEAERIVAEASGRAARAERALYYPYVCYRLRYELPTIFGRPRFEIECLVEGRRGLVSSADPFETIELRPSGNDVLPLRLDADTAARLARRAMSQLLGKRHRSVAPLSLEVGRGELLHKAFWVVGCGGDGSQVLVDSTTGRYFALGCRPAAA